MASQARLSLTNHCANATMLTGSGSFQAGWPSSNAKFPQQPFVIAKTDNITGDKDLRFDLGSALTIDIVLFCNTNYTVAGFVVGNDATFASSTYSTLAQITRNAWNRRYTWCHLLTPPQTVRYINWRIPSGTGTVDGQSYYSTGGVWAGPLTALPRDIRWDERPFIRESHIDVPLLGGGTQRVQTGRPYVEMTARRLAKVRVTTPASDDELGSWLGIDRQMLESGHFAWFFNRGNTSEGFIFRKMNESNWNVHQVLSEDDLILHEVVGP